ncbi:MAG TPA: 4-hydroxy-tetrahydrodipicolinate synthase, partial [Firmicutes bacterium]|nr:4-hydroxy-tetrahydrodipicolinate synthase [Bacillota bacterium]
MKSGQLFTAMITPMNKDRSVNYRAAVDLARRLGENGSDGVVLSGTTGESPTLSFDEKVKLFSEVTDALGGQVEIIAGTGSNSTEDTITLTKAAENAGVDGIMLVTPYYNKPSQQGLYEHFKAVALQTSLP